MTKYLLTLLFGLCAVGGFGVALYLVLSNSEPEAPIENPASSPVLPTPSIPQPGIIVADTETMSVRTKDGAVIQVHDVRKDPGVEKEDYTIDGPVYVFYREPSMQNKGGYQLLFEERTQSFLVTIFDEPIQSVRENALLKLRNHLGVSQETLCRLTISVRVVDDVRPGLTDVEVGVPFCGGMNIDDI